MQHDFYECENCGVILKLRYDEKGKTKPCPACGHKHFHWVDLREMTGIK